MGMMESDNQASVIYGLRCCCDLPYYASLADGNVWQLLIASTGSLVCKLCSLAVLAIAVKHKCKYESSSDAVQLKLELVLVGIFTIFGLASFITQGKGYSYQLYPYISFLLLFAALIFSQNVSCRKGFARTLGIVGFGFGISCASTYLHYTSHAKWSMPVTIAFENAIRAYSGLDGPASLNGQVQCIDAVSGCTDALLHLHLRQATGIMYDEYLFPQTPAPWGTIYTGFPPGSPLPPWFDQWLGEHYTLASQQDFPRAENGPMGFRVYVRR